jgi:hypothetical protein
MAINNLTSIDSARNIGDCFIDIRKEETISTFTKTHYNVIADHLCVDSKETIGATWEHSNVITLAIVIFIGALVVLFMILLDNSIKRK